MTDDRPDISERIRELTGAIEAPAELRARIAAGEPARARHRRRRAWLALPAAGLAAAAVVVALVLGGGGGAAGTPSVDAAAALALTRPDLPAPKVDDADPHLVQARIAGIQFPNYAYAWKRWRAIGHRRGELSGRAATAVTYRGPIGDVGYAIVSGAPLAEPDGARHRTENGVRLAIVRRGDLTVVTWRRDGHTCVLAGRGPGMEERLVSFASWA
jgi:hypothetical protein